MRIRVGDLISSAWNLHPLQSRDDEPCIDLWCFVLVKQADAVHCIFDTIQNKLKAMCAVRDTGQIDLLNLGNAARL